MGIKAIGSWIIEYGDMVLYILWILSLVLPQKGRLVVVLLFNGLILKDAPGKDISCIG